LLPLFATGVNDTGGKFAAGIVDTGGKFSADIVDTSGKFATGINNASETGGKICRRCPINRKEFLSFYVRASEKFQNLPRPLFRSTSVHS